MTTDEAVLALLALVDAPLVETDGRAWRALERFQLAAESLSGGEQAIVGIAAAVWNPYTATATIADVGKLDVGTRRAVLSIIASYYLDEAVTL